MAVWVCVWLVALEVGIHIRLDPADTGVHGFRARLAHYFDYGRSRESRIRRALASPKARDWAMLRAGWLDPDDWSGLPARPEPGGRLVALYGNSFSNNLATQLESLEPGLRTRSVWAPVAPPSYAFAAHARDRGRDHAAAAVLTVLASSVPALGSMTRATLSSIEPNPYTYPRYRLEQGKLVAGEPIIHSLAALEASLDDPVSWNAWLEQLAADDLYYQDWIYRASWMDRSALLRLLRNAWSIRHVRRVRARYGTFDPDSEGIAVLRALLVAFSREVRAYGGTPLVLVVNDFGSGDALMPLLAGTLEDAGIPYLDSNRWCPSDTAASFQAAHFAPACREQLGRALLERLGRSGGRSRSDDARSDNSAGG